VCDFLLAPLKRETGDCCPVTDFPRQTRNKQTVVRKIMFKIIVFCRSHKLQRNKGLMLADSRDLFSKCATPACQIPAHETCIL